MEKLENEDKESIPSEKHYEDFEPAVIPVAPDGGVPVGFALEQPPAPPAVSASICLKGPCRHYWRMVTMAGEGNPSGTFEGPSRLIDPLTQLPVPRPRQHHHVCLVNPGMETILNDDCVYECSRWDPMTSGEAAELVYRRKAYMDAHPELDESALDQLTEEVDEGDLDGSEAAQG